MEGSAQSLWERCLPIIRNNVDEKQYRTWFEPIQIISFEKQVLTFGLPSQYFYEFFVGTFRPADILRRTTSFRRRNAVEIQPDGRPDPSFDRRHRAGQHTASDAPCQDTGNG